MIETSGNQGVVKSNWSYQTKHALNPFGAKLHRYSSWQSVSLNLIWIHQRPLLEKAKSDFELEESQPLFWTLT